MAVQLNLVYQSVLLIAAVVSGVLAVTAYRKRGQSGAQWLTILMVGTTLWSLTSLWFTVAGSFDTKYLAAMSTYVAVPIVVYGWITFTLDYTGREHLLTRRNLALLGIHPVFAVGMAYTNPIHQLWWSRIVRPAGPEVIDFVSRGLAWQIHTAYSYGLLAIGAGLILVQIVRSRSVFRGQGLAMLVAVVVPTVGNVLFLFVLNIEADLTPVGFAISGLAVFGAVYEYGLMDVAPVAQNKVLDKITDGVFVVDESNTFVEINPMAKRLLGVTEQDVIGRGMSEVLSENEALLERYETLRETTEEISIDTADGRRYFHVEIQPLFDNRDEFIGRMFIVRDITEQKRRETELERQNEQLEQFASLVSHDLKNPLTAAESQLETALKTGNRSDLASVANPLERMESLIDDVLMLAKQGQTIDQDEMETVDLGRVAKEVWQGMQTHDARLGIQTERYVRADKDRLERLLQNLFQNSIDHGGRDVTVRVGVIGSTDTVSLLSEDEQGFFVEDDGPGIPPERRGDVFEAGYTSGSETNTGLGLVIVRSIAEAHGWSVGVGDSEAAGARFEVTGVVTP